MIVDYKIIESEIEIQDFNSVWIDISKRISYIAIIDGVEQEVSLSWLRVLMKSKMYKLNSEISSLKSKIYKELRVYTLEHNLKEYKDYVFDYDSNICVCLCTKRGE